MYGKQYKPWSDATFCGVWSGTTLFAKAYLSQYLELLQYYLLKTQLHEWQTVYLFELEFYGPVNTDMVMSSWSG